VALLNEAADAPLIDGHCHPVVTEPVQLPEFEWWCSESASPRRPGESTMDSSLGYAIRRWCPPVLGLPPHAPLADYLWVRGELGPAEVTARLLRAANLAGLLVDTGLPAAELTDLRTLAQAAAAPVHEVVRLETLAERVAASGSAAEFASAFRDALVSTCDSGAVAVKSIVAYRHSLAVASVCPGRSEVTAAVGRWLRESGPSGEQPTRLTDPLLLSFLLWTAVDLGRPIQLHTGFGDADAAITGSDPGLLQPFCAATQQRDTTLVLLHAYPYHRQAAWLAHVFPHVYVDVGLTVPYVGARASAVLAEFLELAPYGKVLYSSDGYGLPELHLTGAALFRQAIVALFDAMVAQDAMTEGDAARDIEAIGSANARRIYRVP
jgi:uncharacterized protein